MSKPESYYWSDEMKRTLEELINLCTKNNNFGCISPPLLHIKLANVRIDELHLLLRITGKYMSTLIQCQQADWNKVPSPLLFQGK